MVLGLALVALAGMWRSSQAGHAGQAELTRAETDLVAQRIDAARQDMAGARADFTRMRAQLHQFPFGLALSFWRAVPLVRLQVRAVDTFADVGVSLSQAGQRIADAAATIEHPSGAAVPLSGSLDKLRTAQTSLTAGIKALDDATVRINAMNNYRLLGPIGTAHRAALRRLTRIDATAKSAGQAVAALITFTGGEGPRNYLVLSQNPAEVRPTGGFIGSYGVLTADGGQVGLNRYDDSLVWIVAHPTAIIPAAQLGSPFRFYDPPLDQTLANVNATPDWPAAAQLALKLWQQGGEAPADGVLSFTPEFLARVLAVTGPVSVPSYNETITSGNVISKLDYYTHGGVKPPPGVNRKEFLSPLGQAVMTKLLQAPPSQWRGLGTALGKAFAARELLVWSRDSSVQSTLDQRGWVGVLPSSDGDFFYDGEFEYGAKNGRGLKRTFDHHVVLHADGSAQVTTTFTIDNTEGPSQVNDNVLTYYTLYGPSGAVVNTDASDPPFGPEAALAGHPASGWFRTVTANSSGTIKVVWDVPTLGLPLSDGSWQYELRWLPVVDNTGDILKLTVDLPPGAHWVGNAPPATTALNHEVNATWGYRLAAGK